MRGERGSGQRPLQAGASRGGEFRARPAGLSCEARFELLYSAWLRGFFGVKWAVPRWTDPG
jgi:hypothetical protein